METKPASHFPTAYINGIEHYETAEGVFGLSTSTIGKLCNVSQTNISRLKTNLVDKSLSSKHPLKALESENYIIFSGRSTGNLTLWGIEAAKKIVSYYIYKGKYTPEGCKFVGLPIPSSSSKAKAYTNPEAEHRDLLHSLLGGEIEVRTPVGRIDLLTAEEVIEVKAAKDWKSALGQVLAYSYFYPNHSKRLHLYGLATSDTIQVISDICSRCQVDVSWANQADRQVDSCDNQQLNKKAKRST